MFETQQSFLEKQNVIILADVNKLKKRINFDHDFIMYGEKNNKLMEKQINIKNKKLIPFEDENQKLSDQIIMLNKDIESKLLKIKYLESGN